LVLKEEKRRKSRCKGTPEEIADNKKAYTAEVFERI
jgi:hypothetical protein